MSIKKEKRIIARGEHSNHAHILIGERIEEKDGKFYSNSDQLQFEQYQQSVINFQNALSVALQSLPEEEFEIERDKLFFKFQSETKDLKDVIVLKHLMESAYLESDSEVWTKEHLDIPLPSGEIEFIQQVEYHPYDEEIRKVQD